MSAAAARLLRVELTDRHLVSAIAAGDLTCLGILFDRYGDDVRRVLARLGVSSCDLDDLVQQTFLDVPRASARFRDDGAVRPWLIGLATMVARRRRRSLARMFRRLEAWASEPHEPVRTPADSYEQQAELARVWEALDRLSPKQRDAFVLVVLEGLPGAEAAEILAIPIATIWTRIHHARNELRRALETDAA
jgi:RNA polymerase sigma-70 factor (ECF subfamily)